MNFPDDVLMIIKEFSMPCTRPDWRQGCNHKRTMIKLDPLLEYESEYGKYLFYYTGFMYEMLKLYKKGDLRYKNHKLY